MELNMYLDKLENLVEPKYVKDSEKLQEKAWNFQNVARLPRIISCRDEISKEKHPLADWPFFNYGEVFSNKEKMLIDELSAVYEGAILRDDRMYTIRANYGLGIVPSLFGCKVILRKDKDMPWVEPLSSLEEVEKLIERGIPELDSPLVRKVVETEDFFVKKIKEYNKLREVVHIYLCDTQGPFNLATHILGPRIYTDLYDNPDIVHRLLDLVTKTYIEFTKKQKKFIGEDMYDGYHFQYRLQGGVRISEDDGLNLSPEIYEEFVRPYNKKLLEIFQGGFMLYCGENASVLDCMLETKGLRAIHSNGINPERLPEIYKKAWNKKICVLWDGEIPPDYESSIKTGLINRRFVRSLDEARSLRDELIN